MTSRRRPSAADGAWNSARDRKAVTAETGYKPP